MSASTAIALVGQTLQNLLANEMAPGLVAPVTIQAPDETGANRRINLFLYRIMPNTMLTNLDWHALPGSDPTRLVPPPLPLKLYYLMTAYVPNDDTSQNTAAHAVMGEAMRVLYENSIVPTAYLAAGLSDAYEQIKAVLHPMEVEEILRIWSTFSEPYRLSVSYEVSTVQLDMQPDREIEMAPRVRTVGIPDIRAPFHPPRITHIVPGSGPPGTTVTVHGQHFTGWRAYVTFTGQVLLNAEPIPADDQFTITIPGDALVGFHEIRTDISHLHRSTQFFEVTAP